jgi:type II secretory pathway component PulC
MIRNYYLLNVFLAFIITLLGVHLYKVLAEPLEIPTGPEPATSRIRADRINATVSHGTDSSFDVIVSQNLFHPSRSSIQKTPDVSKPVLRNEIPQLFGTIIMSDKKMAILEDRSSKKSSLYGVHDSVSGFLVAQIMENKVILRKGGEKIEVNLREDKKISRPKRTQGRKRAVRNARKRRSRPRRIRRSRAQRRRPPVTRRER